MARSSGKLRAGSSRKESSSTTRRATPTRGKTPGRHVRGARIPDQGQGFPTLLSLLARERGRRLRPTGRGAPSPGLGPAPESAVGSHSPATGRRATDRQLDWANQRSGPPARTGRRARSVGRLGPKGKRPVTGRIRQPPGPPSGEARGRKLGLAQAQTRAAIRFHAVGHD